jgi:hypothetical protein
MSKKLALRLKEARKLEWTSHDEPDAVFSPHLRTCPVGAR